MNVSKRRKKTTVGTIAYKNKTNPPKAPIIQLISSLSQSQTR